MPQKNNPALSTEILNQIFLHNLNRIYFGKSYLNTHLEDLVNRASFPALQLAMGEFADDVKRQLKRILKIYSLIGEEPSDKDCNPIKAIVKEKFCLDDTRDMPIVNDADVILYVQLLEHVNITTFRMLKTLASKLKMAEATQLLMECFDESKDDDQLFVLILKEYLS